MINCLKSCKIFMTNLNLIIKKKWMKTIYTKVYEWTFQP